MDIYDLGSNGDSETGRIYLCLLICNFLYIKELWKQMGTLDLWGYERNKKKLTFQIFLLSFFLFRVFIMAWMKLRQNEHNKETQIEFHAWGMDLWSCVASSFLGYRQSYTYHVLQTIQIELILLCVWAEPAVLGSAKTTLKFKYRI